VVVVLVQDGSWATWPVMCAAMMLPAVLPDCRRIALSGLSRWRRRGPALVVAAFLGVWTATGIALVPAAGLVAGSSLPAVLALVAAAAWELTAAKRRAILACHRFAPVAPRGMGAIRGYLREGARHGVWCVASCGFLMTSVALAGHDGLLVMVVATVVTAVQKQARQGFCHGRTVAVVLMGLAGLVAV
jgi:predicted metal-binding membrane protein